MDEAELIGRVEELTAELETIEDGPARRCAEELTSAVMEMYGAGLERIMEALEQAPEVRDQVADDGVVASLLLIHDLYPVPLEERVHQALGRVRPYMESHGGDVELLGIDDGVVRLRLQGSCSSCQASQATLELAVKQALEELAPDLEGMDVRAWSRPSRPRPCPGSSCRWRARRTATPCRPGSTWTAPAGSGRSSCWRPRWPASGS